MNESDILFAIKDGDATHFQPTEAPSKGDITKPLEGNVRKKRRRGKYKRKVIKPFGKVPWQERWKKDKPKRNNRFRKIVLAKTQAPFNNNQFLMEIHKPEPENTFSIMQAPSARTRDSSFSMDSEDNYFYSLPENEEEYLTKEFSSVYEDAQSERLANMSKNELIQEYLLLEAKYDNLVKRSERYRSKPTDEDTLESEKETLAMDKDSIITERDTSMESSALEDTKYIDLLQRMKEQEDQVHQLQLANEKLRIENECLHKRNRVSSSEDSESDSSSSSSDTGSSSNSSIAADLPVYFASNNEETNNGQINDQTEEIAETVSEPQLVNGFHSPDK